MKHNLFEAFTYFITCLLYMLADEAMEIHREGSSFLRRLRQGAVLRVEELTEAFSRVVARSKKIVQVATCHKVDDVAGSSSGPTAPHPHVPRPGMFCHPNIFPTICPLLYLLKYVRFG